MRRLALIVFSSSTALLAPPAAAQEWAGFRGPQGAGCAEGAALPLPLTAEHVAWRVALAGSGHASVVAWGEQAFTTAVDEDGALRLVVAHALDDGAELWVHAEPFEPHPQHRLNSFASSTPAVDGERVYVLGTSGERLFAQALDHDGEPLWRRDLGPCTAQHGFGSSPVLAGRVLVVQNDHEGERSAVVGLDPESGEVRWRIERTSSRASYATPVTRRRDDGGSELYLASTSHGVSCVDPSDGSLRWERDDLFEQRTVATPVLAGDVVLLLAGSGGGGKESAAVELEESEAGAHAVRYRVRRALPYVPTPLYHDGLVFLWSDSGVASCLDAASGEALWQERAGGDYYASPVLVGEAVVSMSNAGELVALRAGPAFEELARLELGEPGQASPSVARGRLLLRTERHLLAIPLED